jgi:DNA-binding transcriptional LysR family regulator
LPDSSLVARKIATLQWVVCASPEYLARRGEPKTPSDLSKHACLAHVNLDPNDHAWRLHNSDHVISVKIAGAFSSNSALVLRKAALAGLGIAYLPRYSIDEDLKSGTLRQLLPSYSPRERSIYVVYPPASRVPERVRTFVDFLADWFGNSRATKLGQNSRKRNLEQQHKPRKFRSISTY